MPFQRLKKQWSEISLEKKLAMFVAPVFVAVVSGILISGISGAFGSDDSSTTIDAGGLEVVDLEVTSGEVADEPGAPVDAPLIDLTVRNTGQEVSIITGANLQVRNMAWIQNCEGGAGLDPSSNTTWSFRPSRSPGRLSKSTSANKSLRTRLIVLRSA